MLRAQVTPQADCESAPCVPRTALELATSFIIIREGVHWSFHRYQECAFGRYHDRFMAAAVGIPRAFGRRRLDSAMLDPVYREQFSDALAIVVSDQERAGLDIVTCGDYFLDADLAGQTWTTCSVAALARGLADDELKPRVPALTS